MKKKANIVPIHKKESKNFIKKNIDTSVFYQYLEKIFERIISNNLFHHFIKNKCQSGFLPSDLCLYHLLSIVQEVN